MKNFVASVLLSVIGSALASAGTWQVASISANHVGGWPVGPTLTINSGNRYTSVSGGGTVTYPFPSTQHDAWYYANSRIVSGRGRNFTTSLTLQRENISIPFTIRYVPNNTSDIPPSQVSVVVSRRFRTRCESLFTGNNLGTSNGSAATYWIDPYPAGPTLIWAIGLINSAIEAEVSNPTSNLWKVYEDVVCSASGFILQPDGSYIGSGSVPGPLSNTEQDITVSQSVITTGVPGGNFAVHNSKSQSEWMFRAYIVNGVTVAPRFTSSN